MADNEIHTDHPGVNPDPGVTRAPAGDATSSKDASQATQQTKHGARELASKAQASTCTHGSCGVSTFAIISSKERGAGVSPAWRARGPPPKGAVIMKRDGPG